MRDAPTLRLLGACAALLVSAAAAAGPWIETGESDLRHHVEVLADAGVIRSPVTTWPMSWGGVARDLAQADPQRLGDMEQESLYTLLGAMDEQSGLGVDFVGGVNAATSDAAITGFGSSRRENQQVSFRADWLGETTAASLSAQYVRDPLDERKYRLDGSYVAQQLGNWALSAGMTDRWWGPGWQSSLILSDNARPVPAVSLQRIVPAAPDWRVLSWIGPWQFTSFFGRMEAAEQSVPEHFLLGARLTVKPLSFLEIGLSRTAQWGGDGRPTSLSSLLDLIAGIDNQDGSQQKLQSQPGNQLGGFDGRLSFPLAQTRNAVYGQAIGEDEAHGRPSKYIFLGGFESGFAMGAWQHRLVLEAVDTKAHSSTRSYPESEPGYNIAYEHFIYTSGYRRYGRPIAASIDNDSRMLSVSGQHIPSRGRQIIWTLADLQINRDGADVPPPGGSVYGSAAQDTTYARLAYVFPVMARSTVELGGEYYADDLVISGEKVSSGVFLNLSMPLD